MDNKPYNESKVIPIKEIEFDILPSIIRASALAQGMVVADLYGDQEPKKRRFDRLQAIEPETPTICATCQLDREKYCAGHPVRMINRL